MKKSKAYAQAGVDIALADRLLDKVKPALKRATRPESLGGIGGFGGLFDISKLARRLKHPVLVSSTDSVGTKVKAASLAGEYRFLGADIVNHCANDVAVCGAEPLYFLDYYATGELEERAYLALLRGLAGACEAGNIALVGGETAELPGVYVENEFDLVGTIVGVVDKSKLLTGKPIKAGDRLIGLQSSGLHTNGFSLARKLYFDHMSLSPADALPGARGTVASALLKPHVNYAPFLQAALKGMNKAANAGMRKGNQLFAAAHITGGGFKGNLSRVLNDKVDAIVDTRKWKPLTVFQAMANTGEVDFQELYEVFNMGVGMVLVVSPDAVDGVIKKAATFKHRAWDIGEITKGSGLVEVVG
jgi:phosphoribosylformylglycinamidine cyclo-ligase|tara:strand:- start:24085 stop:25164 length:1080 start_codon:yes stop_codon:yes gene_type:complete